MALEELPYIAKKGDVLPYTAKKGDDAILDCLGFFRSVGVKLCSNDCGLLLRALQSAVPALDIDQFWTQLAVAVAQNKR